MESPEKSCPSPTAMHRIDPAISAVKEVEGQQKREIYIESLKSMLETLMAQQRCLACHGGKVPHLMSEVVRDSQRMSELSATLMTASLPPENTEKSCAASDHTCAAWPLMLEGSGGEGGSGDEGQRAWRT